MNKRVEFSGTRIETFNKDGILNAILKTINLRRKTVSWQNKNINFLIKKDQLLEMLFCKGPLS